MSEEPTVDKKATDIRVTVAQRLAASGPDVLRSVVKILVNKELDDRAQLILQGMAKLAEFDGQLKKFKPDQVIMGEDGEKTTEGYSQQKFAEKKKIQENIQKVEKSIDLALGDNPDYTPLKKTLDKGKDQ